MESPDPDRTSPPSSSARAELARAKRYYTRIENTIVALRGGGFILSPRDFQILEDWYERGVPAELVIATLEEVFAKKADRPESRRPWTIAYCRRPVERAWEERRAALLGLEPAQADREGRKRPSSPRASHGGSFTPEQVSAHLASVAARTRAAAAESLWSGEALTRARDGLTEVAARLDALADMATIKAAGRDLPALEEQLVGLEERAISVARDAMPAPELEEIVAKATADMGGATARMSAKAREATLRRAIDAAIRRRLGLPRYSLFTMTV